MKNSFKITIAAILAALTISGCNNTPAPADTTAASAGNVTTAGTEVPETTTEEPFVPVVEGEPLPGADCAQGNVGMIYLNPIMEIDEGYFYNSITPDLLSLHYHDNATDKNVYLCAKPECLHNGSDFCPATTARYKPITTLLYGDKIYMSVIDQVEYEKENYVMKLIAASLDGTSLSEVAEVVKVTANSELSMFNILGSRQSMVIHRGKALVPYDMWSNTADERSMVCGYAVIDLATGNVDYREESSDKIGSHFIADGNGFYYRTVESGPNPGSAYDISTFYDVWRYDIREKKSRRLNVYDSYLTYLGHDSSMPKLKMFAVADGRIYYSSGDISGETCGVFIYDMATGETREFSELKEIKFEKYTADGELYYLLFSSAGDDITYDGKYLYIAKGDGLANTHTSRDPECYVTDTSGKYYGKIEYDFGSYHGLYSMSFINGNVYIQTNEKVISASVDGLLNGTDDWHDLFTFEGVEYLSYN